MLREKPANNPRGLLFLPCPAALDALKQGGYTPVAPHGRGAREGRWNGLGIGTRHLMGHGCSLGAWLPRSGASPPRADSGPRLTSRSTSRAASISGTPAVTRG